MQCKPTSVDEAGPAEGRHGGLHTDSGQSIAGSSFAGQLSGTRKHQEVAGPTWENRASWCKHII